MTQRIGAPATHIGGQLVDTAAETTGAENDIDGGAVDALLEADAARAAAQEKPVIIATTTQAVHPTFSPVLNESSRRVVPPWMFLNRAGVGEDLYSLAGLMLFAQAGGIGDIVNSPEFLIGGSAAIVLSIAGGILLYLKRKRDSMHIISGIPSSACRTSGLSSSSSKPPVRDRRPSGVRAVGAVPPEMVEARKRVTGSPTNRVVTLDDPEQIERHVPTSGEVMMIALVKKTDSSFEIRIGSATDYRQFALEGEHAVYGGILNMGNKASVTNIIRSLMASNRR